MAARLPTFGDLLAARRRLGTLACRTPLIEHPALNARVGRARAAQGREPAAGRRLQVPRRLQQDGAGRQGCLPRRRGGLLVRQPRAGRGRGGDADGLQVGDRDAGRCAAPQDRAHARRSAPRSWPTIASRRIATPSRASCAAARRAAYVHPFDDPDVIAGQGTAGLEMMEQAEAIGATPDIVLVGASGGGLISGVSIAVKEKSPSTVIYSRGAGRASTISRARSRAARARGTRRSRAPSAMRCWRRRRASSPSRWPSATWPAACPSPTRRPRPPCAMPSRN